MSWSLLSLVPPPPHLRRPVTLATFTTDYLPAVICYYATAILVILPRTYAIRMALLPITVWAAFRAATQLGFSAGWSNEEALAYLNQGLLLTVCTIVMRVFIWTFQQQPYRRLCRPISKPLSAKEVAIDAFDLSYNLRGVGWNWSEGVQIPKETRPLHSKSAFLRHTTLSLTAHFVVFDCLHYALQCFGPETIGSPYGGTIFDASLPPLLRYTRSSVIVFLAGMAVCLAIQGIYHFFTLISVALLRQEPSQWPPLFDQPWFSTSHTRLWSHDWHQLFRDNFISFGGRPLATITGTGRFGMVMGAFLVSGLLHDFAVWGMGKGSDFPRVGGFFLMMGVGILIEGAVKKYITGKKVEGFTGWVWTIVWMIVWGHGLVDAWTQRGVIGSAFMPSAIRPSLLIVDALRKLTG